MACAYQTLLKPSTKRPGASSTFGLHTELWMGPQCCSHRSPEMPINSYALIAVRGWGAAGAAQTRLLSFQLQLKKSFVSGSLPASHCSTPATHRSILCIPALPDIHSEQGWMCSWGSCAPSLHVPGEKSVGKFKKKKSLHTPQLKNNYQTNIVN